MGNDFTNMSLLIEDFDDASENLAQLTSQIKRGLDRVKHQQEFDKQQAMLRERERSDAAQRQVAMSNPNWGMF